jgi:2-dehydropantoate 2-reductase
MLLRFLIFGAGAIGTYIGGSLALAGHKVVFFERPEIALRLRERGISLEINTISRHIAEVEVADSLIAALTKGPYDVAILAVKSYDTEDVLQSLSPYVAALPVFLCLQNGVENEGALARILGEERVIAGTVTSAVGRRDAGDIILERYRGMGVAAGHALAIDLVLALNLGGLNAKLYPQAASLKWSKMLTNLMANASSAILNLAPHEIYADPALYQMEIEQMREALNIMDALNIKVTDLPGTPVRLLTRIVRRFPPSLSRPLLARALSSGRGAKMPSFYLDLVGGRGKSEVAYLNGAVVRYGEKTGIPTPVNQVYTRVLTALACGDVSRAEFDHQPQKLINLVQEARVQ